MGVGTSGREQDVRKKCRRLNVVKMLYTCVCQWKTGLVELFQESVEGGIKGNDGGSKI
jgi:hypothetical protein